MIKINYKINRYIDNLPNTDILPSDAFTFIGYKKAFKTLYHLFDVLGEQKGYYRSLQNLSVN